MTGLRAASADIVAAAEKKAAQAEKDLAEKRIPYEADPLFMYLWKRGFGTASYGSKGLVRFLDRKVAQLIRYDEARQNYSVLLDLPVRLREHVARLRSRVGGGA